MSLLGAFGSVGGLSATPFILYAILAVFTGILLINIKGLPGFWHVRLFKGITTQLFHAKRRNFHRDNDCTAGSGITNASSPNSDQPNGVPQLFSYLITEHRNFPIDCDYNMHKSNSTFFSDLDINRTQLLLNILGGFPRWKTADGTASPSNAEGINAVNKQDRPKRGSHQEKSLGIALGGVSCMFKKEIKPFQKYEIWSRVISWDEKWLYVVSYFVKDGMDKSALRPSSAKSQRTGREGNISSLDAKNYILSSSLSRYVFKDGRRTVKPQDVLVYMGLYPDGNAEASTEEVDGDSTSESLAMITEKRKRGLEAVKHFSEMDSLPLHFGDTMPSVLGRYMDL
ncbi:hypothetical protein H112_00372 [Trichophyton rubrum D6]|uniref:Thioesterase n=3 Tax=Trichophyton rubrum TaxID=5551 RepID=A0A178F862_TRIRU|nr:uncharacterized protein TERG_08297 [Trichophyton rubrum CBS 118892]EZF27696.1 hypothetical protein H100_00373 [Trichophyton rubrum MR850]EZF46676.1 hypothetical protein H102_00372 [Trichophyton rubrum CBS 100081]EZF57341.1 hypothetical protein H103_00371 [Trichophyton rubrum CBS 288.86]EZF67918.1 hypothetical protein H104_00372 [Trichophyton rubrum CBS 289.86]EZF89276.1 hypothetical protein H110_00375 [Trichophyton rubrum MR1448]EZG00051.1 hypothetical protein H113_00375 [Trichophyton rubr